MLKKSLMAVLTFGAVLLSSLVALADTEVDIHRNQIGDTVDYGGHRSDGRPAAAGNTAGLGGRQQALYRATLPELTQDPAGQTCVTTVTRSYADAASAAAADAAQEQRWLGLLGAGYPLCPGVTAPAGNPAGLAIAFWGEVPLPVPAPRIAPGYAITGKPAYLETGGVLARDFARETPLGPITLGASGRLWVDWGDGTHDGPFDVPGAPWPAGTISHTYTNTGAFDVVVTEQWGATWQLAGQGGQLGGLHTEGRISRFPVTEVQAVRNR
jgi:hypothetical protein